MRVGYRAVEASGPGTEVAFCTPCAPQVLQPTTLFSCVLWVRWLLWRCKCFHRPACTDTCSQARLYTTSSRVGSVVEDVETVFGACYVAACALEVTISSLRHFALRNPALAGRVERVYMLCT